MLYISTASSRSVIEQQLFTITIRPRCDCDSTAVRLPFDCISTALQPFDDLRYDRRPTCMWVPAEASVTAAIGSAARDVLRHCDLYMTFDK